MMVKRLYVHEEIYDEFRAKLMVFVGSLKVGDGTEADVFFGPVACSTTRPWISSGACPRKVSRPPSVETSRTRRATSSARPSSISGFIPGSVGSAVRADPILPMLRWSDEDNVIA